MNTTNKGARVAISGYYGHGNFGDDHFVHKSIEACAQVGLIPLLATPPVADLPDATFITPRRLRRAYSSHTRSGSVIRLISALALHARCKTHILAGGSILSDISGARRAQMILERVIGRRAWIGLGVSLGPFKSEIDEQDVRAFCSTARSIVVRDSRSLNIARQWGLVSAMNLGDLAALGENPVRKSVRHVALVCCREVEDSDMLEIAHTTARMAASAGWTMSVVSINSNPTTGDDAQARYISRALEADGVVHDLLFYGSLGYQATLHHLTSSATVSGRLHGGLVSLFSGYPSAIVEYHPKVSAILDDLDLDENRRIRLSNSPSLTNFALSHLSCSESRKLQDYCSRAGQILNFLASLK